MPDQLYLMMTKSKSATKGICERIAINNEIRHRSVRRAYLPLCTNNSKTATVQQYSLRQAESEICNTLSSLLSDKLDEVPARPNFSSKRVLCQTLQKEKRFLGNVQGSVHWNRFCFPFWLQLASFSEIARWFSWNVGQRLGFYMPRSPQYNSAMSCRWAAKAVTW